MFWISRCAVVSGNARRLEEVRDGENACLRGEIPELSEGIGLARLDRCAPCTADRLGEGIHMRLLVRTNDGEILRGVASQLAGAVDLRVEGVLEMLQRQSVVENRQIVLEDGGHAASFRMMFARRAIARPSRCTPFPPLSLRPFPLAVGQDASIVCGRKEGTRNISAGSRVWYRENNGYRG